MTSELSRVEITKLAAATGIEETDLAFLADRTAEELRELRRMVERAVFARNEGRVRTLASLSRRLPPPLTARIAQLALGPLLSGRIAGALDPEAAATLAEQVDPEFLSALAAAVDPSRVAAIIAHLPQDLIVDVGRRLLVAREYLTLGRFVGVVDPDIALAVVDGVTGEELLQVVLYADEPAALEPMIERLPAATVAVVADAARAAGVYDELAALAGNAS